MIDATKSGLFGRGVDGKAAKTLTALTVGGAMIDTIAIIENTGIERISLKNAGTSFLLLEEGGKTEAAEVSTHTGGGAINAAVALARLGLSVSALVKLGCDRRAEQILARLDEERIAHDWVVRAADAPTGASVHISSHDRNAAVFTFRGANTELEPSDLSDEAFAVDLVYIANLSNEAAHCFPLTVEKAKANGALVAANPGIRQLTMHRASFEASLPAIDILSLNRREADEVVSILDRDEVSARGGFAMPPGSGEAPPLASRGLRHEGRSVSLGAFLGALLSRGAGCVVITDGRDGAFAATNGSLAYCPAREVEVLGTAGAGDAFAATFAAFRASGADLDISLSAASLNAAGVLQHVDTQTGLMHRRAIEAMLAEAATPNVTSWILDAHTV